MNYLEKKQKVEFYSPALGLAQTVFQGFITISTLNVVFNSFWRNWTHERKKEDVQRSKNSSMVK